MKVHFYDAINNNLLGSFNGEDFTSIDISHNIDGYSTCSVSDTWNESLSVVINGFENIYIEDDDGTIIFGGVITGANADRQSNTFTAIDHRWFLSKILLDEDLEITEETDIVDAIDDLIIGAKLKRNIPIIFDTERSEVITDGLNVIFNEGDDVAGVLQALIQNLSARWAIRYKKEADKILGYMFVRSISGITPEGVGVSRTYQKSEDGDILTLRYTEGSDLGNVDNFRLNLDMTPYNSYTKVGYRVSGQSETIDVLPAGNFIIYNFLFGRAEKHKLDYKAQDESTARAIGQIEQTYPKQTIDLIISPKFTEQMNCGDRINLQVKSNKLDIGVDNFAVRIDGVRLSRASGYWNRTITLNTFPSQNLEGAGLLDSISKMNRELNGLNQNYFNN